MNTGHYLAVTTDRHGNMITMKAEMLASEDEVLFSERIAIQMREKLGLFFLERDLLLVPVRTRAVVIHKRLD